MSDIDLIDAVAQKTGEDAREIRRHGFLPTWLRDMSCDPRRTSINGRLATRPMTALFDGIQAREPKGPSHDPLSRSRRR
jgi:hypothetical protein